MPTYEHSTSVQQDENRRLRMAKDAFEAFVCISVQENPESQELKYLAAYWKELLRSINTLIGWDPGHLLTLWMVLLSCFATQRSLLAFVSPHVPHSLIFPDVLRSGLEAELGIVKAGAFKDLLKVLMESLNATREKAIGDMTMGRSGKESFECAVYFRTIRARPITSGSD
jgi:hypothetical protein